MTNGKFRISSKSLSLTWSNPTKSNLGGELTNESILAELTSRLGRFHIKYACVSRETHQSGDPHWHAAVVTNRKIESKKASFLDIEGAHPNIQVTKSITDWITYVKKDGDFVEYGSIDEPSAKPARPTALQILDQAGETEKLVFLAWCAAEKIMYGPLIWEMAHPDLTKTLTLIPGT